MAVRSVATSDTLETFRTTFNSLGTDVGDLSSLTTTDTSSIVAAVNEVNASVTTAFKIADDSSTQQTINSGDVFRISGTSNQVTATVSATDTLTIALASSISGLTSVSATSLVAGTLTLAAGSITDSSGSIDFGNENLATTGTIGTGTLTLAAGSITDSSGSIDFGNENLTTTGTIEGGTITEGGVSLATRPFAIAQAVALG